MSSIVIGKSEGKNFELDLDILLSTRLLLTADSGGGKTFALKRLCEQAFGKLQIIIIDPEGEFAPLRQKFDFVLVGPGGETPADVRSAAMLAVKLLELRASAICDIYDMKPSVRHTWVKLFLDGLIEAPKKLRHPCMVIVDESHIFCPEHGKGESEATDAMKSLCTRGRKRLLCPVFATQRLATLAKDASSMLLNRLIGPTFEDLNRKRAAECLSIARENQHQFMKDIQLLEPGNFYALGRAITREMKLVRIGGISTPHGQEAIRYETAPPPAPDKVKALLPKLADLPKEAEAQARSVAELRQEIRSLRAELRAKPAVQTSKIDEKATQRAVVAALSRAGRELTPQIRQIERAFKDICGEASRAMNNVEVLKKVSGAEIQKGGSLGIAQHPERGTTATNPRLNATAEAAVAAGRTTRHFGAGTPPDGSSSLGSNGKLRSGAERMLAAVVQWGQMTPGQMRSHAGLRKSGTYSTYLGDLRRGGYIEERDGMIYPSTAGRDYCQHVPPAPSSTDEVLAIWKPKLRSGARRMLDILVAHEGNPISREELAQESGLTNSGTFSTYVGELKTARLVVVEHGSLSANREVLFL